METIRVIKVKEDYIIEGLKDYGFKYDSNKRTYKKSGLEVDEHTKTLECVDKCESKDLSVILELEKYGIIYINEIIFVFYNQSDPIDFKNKRSIRIFKTFFEIIIKLYRYFF